MTYVFLNNAISAMGTLLSSFFVYGRAVKYAPSVRTTVLSVIWCFLLSVVYAAAPAWIPLSLVRPFHCAASILFILIVTKQNPDTVISAYLFSYGISYCLHYVSRLSVAAVSSFFLRTGNAAGVPIDYNRPVFLVLLALTFALQLLLAVLLMRIRRFRNGFPFLFKRYAIIAALISTGCLLLFITLARDIAETEYSDIGYLLFAGILVTGIGLYIWIRRGIKAYQKQRMRQRSDEYYANALAEKDAEIERLNAKIMALQTVTHQFTHRLEAMESVLARSAGEEIGCGLAVSVEDVQKVQGEFQDSLGRIKGKKAVPSTNIKAIDNLFAHFAALFAAERIEFNLKVSGSIIYMTEHIIGQSRLETMIGDHLSDALTAVRSSGNTFRGVLAILGFTGEHYEYTVFDSGVPFEPETLIRLGAERVTTHAVTGGSGIGFMTTFETMRACGASLIIDEAAPVGAGFAKSVSILFDGKNRYIIKTRRLGEFPESDRYTVVGHSERRQGEISSPK